MNTMERYVDVETAGSDSSMLNTRSSIKSNEWI